MTAPATHGRRAPGRALKSLLAAPGFFPCHLYPRPARENRGSGASLD